MTIKSLNPNHPTSMAVEGQGLKLLALYMHSRGLDDVVITLGDIERMGHNKAIAIQELEDGLHIRLIDLSEAIAQAKKEGGLPV